MAISKRMIAAFILSLIVLHMVEAQEMIGNNGPKRSLLGIKCEAACEAWCKLSSRPNLCHRACATCCARCGCVPPGTSAGGDNVTFIPTYDNQVQMADKISEGKQASAFGVLAGVSSAAFVCGTISARFLSTAHAFQVAKFSAMAAAAYMRIFLQETNQKIDTSSQPLLKSEIPDSSEIDRSKRIQVFKNIPLVQNMKNILGSRKTFSQVAVMVLFQSLADGGLHASLMVLPRTSMRSNNSAVTHLIIKYQTNISE